MTFVLFLLNIIFSFQIMSSFRTRMIYMNSSRMLNSVINDPGTVTASRYEYTFMASIAYLSNEDDGNSEQEKLLCGGTLVHVLWVITTAICFKDRKPINGYHVHVGIENHETYSYQQTQNISKIIIHPYFDTKTDENNIALVKVQHRFNHTRYVHEVNLPSQPMAFTENQDCSILVYGHIIDKLNKARFSLLKVKLKVLDYIDCQERLKQEIVKKYYSRYTAETFCLVRLSYPPLNESQGACFPDIGNPCLCGDTYQGFIAWANEETCYLNAVPKVPTVIVDVGYYLNWINHNILELKVVEPQSSSNKMKLCPVINILFITFFIYFIINE